MSIRQRPFLVLLSPRLDRVQRYSHHARLEQERDPLPSCHRVDTTTVGNERGAASLRGVVPGGGTGLSTRVAAACSPGRGFRAIALFALTVCVTTHAR